MVIKLKKAIISTLIVIILALPIFSSSIIAEDKDDIEILVRGGFGTTIKVTNNLDEDITVDFNITANGIFSDRIFDDEGQLEVEAHEVSVLKKFVRGFMRLNVTVECEDITIVKSGFSILSLVFFLRD